MIHSEQTENLTYTRVKIRRHIHTKSLAPNNGIIDLSYTRFGYKIDNESFELELIFKCDRNILVLPHQFTKSVLGKVKRLTSVRQQDATLASSGVKIPVNVKMSASMGSSIIQSRS